MLLRAMRKLLPAMPLLVLLAAGCGGSGGNSNNGGGSGLGETPGVKGTTVTVLLRDFEISPGSITLPKPGTYTFKASNEGAQTHNLEVEGKGVEEKGTNVGFGKSMSFTVKFDKAGDYEMYCPVDGHRALGMEGTVTVKGAA
jgi:plastocyanin